MASPAPVRRRQYLRRSRDGTGEVRLAVPRSRCPNCGHWITAFENIPLISWLLLSGRCSDCKHPIPKRYPLVELSTGILSALIAFQFALVGVLPKLAYFTVLDQFITGSTILVFVALVEAVTASFLVSKERTALALRLDTVSRWGFPAAFGLLTLLVFGF